MNFPHADFFERFKRVGNQRPTIDRDERLGDRLGRAAQTRAGARHENDRVADLQCGSR